MKRKEIMKIFLKYGLEKPFKSWRKNKKLAVFVKDNKRKKIIVIHFGDKRYKDFTQHKNKSRRENYLKRSAGIRDKNRRLTKNNKLSPNYWSRRILW